MSGPVGEVGGIDEDRPGWASTSENRGWPVVAMADCGTCGTRITTATGSLAKWLHLADGQDGHEPWPIRLKRPKPRK